MRTIWRECGVAAEEPVERALLCNACVLAESCFYQGEPVFANGEEVLSLLTAREMETLLQQLADGQAALIAANPQIKNPNLIYPGDRVNIP